MQAPHRTGPGNNWIVLVSSSLLPIEIAPTNSLEVHLIRSLVGLVRLVRGMIHHYHTVVVVVDVSCWHICHHQYVIANYFYYDLGSLVGGPEWTN